MMTQIKTISYGCTLFLLSQLLTGCDKLGHHVTKRPIDPPPPYFQRKDKTKTDSESVNNQKNNATGLTKNREIYVGTGTFISNKAIKSSALNASRNGKFKFSFSEQRIEVIIQTILGETLKENYVINPKVGGRVSFETTKHLSKKELIPTLEILLNMHGFALLKRDSLYHIEPISNAAAYSSIILGKKGKKIPAGYQVRIVPLEYVGVEDMKNIIEPLLSKNSILQTDAKRNLMVLAGTSSEMEQAIDIINTFDVDVMDGMSFGLFRLKQVEAKTLIEDLENILENKKEKSLARMLRFVPIERLNAVMVITPQLKYLAKIQTWIERLDKSDVSDSGGIRVYPVQHVDAVQLAETLSAIVDVSIPNNKQSSSSVTPTQQEAEISNVNDKKTTSTTQSSTALKSPSASMSVNSLEGVKIVPDVNNNALIIVASPQQYADLKNIIDKLDKIPLQVLIDATIVSVTLTDELRYGIRWFLTHNNGGENTATSGIGLSDLAAVAATAVNPAFGYAFASKSRDIRAILTAEAKKDTLNVISSPSLMVLNNQEASIQVGEEIPILSSQLTTDTGATSNNVEMRATGVTLTVTPRVNDSDFVTMVIEQSVDNAIPSGTTSGIDSPSILQRKIKSTVAVHDGDTIVLGGLMSENVTDDKTGIPWLHDIPILGNIFGSTVKSTNKTELVILITPTIIKSRNEAKMVAKEFKKRLPSVFADLPKKEQNEK